MGKAKKLKISRRGPKVSLEKQIEDDHFVKPSSRVKVRIRKDEDEEFVDAHLSKRILHEARRQQQEIDDDAGNSSSVSKTQVTKLGDASDDSGDDAEVQDDMDGDYYENIEVDEDDERALEMFMNRNPAPRRTLADIILEKITEKQTELQTQFSDAGSECLFYLDC
ncbi:hypothetical protein B7P43_G07814, partial [Cryptotermes secundus]